MTILPPEILTDKEKEQFAYLLSLDGDYFKEVEQKEKELPEIFKGVIN